VGFFLTRLGKNPVFLRHFGDRAHYHLKEGGILSPGKAAERYRSLLSKVEVLLDAEATRWGDFYEEEALGMDTLEWEYLTSDEGWLFREFFPKRTEILRQQLKKSGLYPKLEAPILTWKRSPDGKLSFAAENPNPAGEIFFSRTGQDPASSDVPEEIERFNGEFVTVSEKAQICARVSLDDQWSALDSIRIPFNP